MSEPLTKYDRGEALKPFLQIDETRAAARASIAAFLSARRGSE